ncbi:polyprenyl synthetase family protein [Candidatus Micrarchaeota archaeon]|nr:polyprenyl synthetase family protein [Candidatus Micrarchaeota archaeon]
MAEKIDIVSILKEKKPAIDAAVEKIIPRNFDGNKMLFICGKPNYEYDLKTATDVLSGPIWNLLDRGGKRWRPALLLIIYEAVGGKKPGKEILEIAAACEVIHNGSLMEDDIEDDSELRRGKPCIHKIYGVDVALNAGSAMYFLPLNAISKNDFPLQLKEKAFETYAQEMINIHFGQGFDIWWHKGNEHPEEKQYLQMCAFKTGTLARLSAKFGALFAGGSEAQVETLGKFAESIGIAFQIQDDILNLVGEKFGELKGVGEDIHEGKRTLLVIHALKKLPPKEAKCLREILDSHPNDQKTINEAISLVKKSGAFEYSQEFSRKLVREAWSGAERVLKESESKRVLKAFADFMIEREI